MENNRPFFSVIIPTYNRGHLITKSIDSLLSQTFLDFEIIIVDDASTDNTGKVIHAINDDRISYILNLTNQERCITRNRGIEASNGKYICFLDSDDYHLPNHLEVIYREIKKLNEPKSFFFVNAWDEDINGNKSERCCPDYEKMDGYTYFLHYTVNPQRWAVHRSIFESIKFDSEVVICEDMDTSLRILANNYPIYQIKERTTVYVAASDSFTNSDANKASKELFYLKRIFNKNELKGKLPRKEINRLLSMCHFHLAEKSNEENSRLKTHYHSLKSFFLFPKGYNGKTNKILFVMNIYQLFLVGDFIKSILNLWKRIKNKFNFSLYFDTTKKIYTKLPLNISEKEKYLFLSKESYRNKHLKIKILKNIYITHWGLLIHNLFLPLKSAENLIGRYDESFYKRHWRVAIEQYLVSKFGKSLPSQHFNDGDYFTIHTPWFGYFSWLTTYLPRLIAVHKKYPDAILLVPKEWESISFVMDSLKLFPDLQREIVKSDHHMFVKNFIFAQVRPWTSQFYLEHIAEIRDLFISNNEQIKSDISPIKRIYVSRKKANRRKITNEKEIEIFLKQHGFQSICFEDYTITEQVALMQNAEILISMHGAGLTNALFLNPKSSLFELTPIVEHQKQFRFPFWRISSILDVNYYVQFCKTIDEGELDFYSRNLEVDMDLFKNNLINILSI